MSRAAIVALVFLLVGWSGVTRAQEPVTEEPDATRLDVERLPPEAIDVSRDLYAHGLFVESHVGARGFIGGAGRLSKPGFHFSLGVGYEVSSWFLVLAKLDASMHDTDAPPPPTRSTFEVLGLLGEARVQINASARAAIWLGAEAGFGKATSDVLTTYGLRQSDEAGLVYGGQLGFDWHFRDRHHSFGLAAGARLHPNLDAFGETAIAVHGTAYLRYVF